MGIKTGNWKTVKLGDVATYINGYAFKPDDWDTKGLPIIRIQNLTGSSQEINFYRKPYNSKYEVNDGDVLISWSASLGVYKWNNGIALLNQHIFKVVFDKIAIEKDYFMYAVKFLLAEMAKETHGSTMKHITKSRFDNVRFPFPPLEIQKQIAKTLDTVVELLAMRKQQLAELDNLIKSIFYDMFGDPVTNEKGWVTNKLEGFATLINGRAYKQEELLKNGKTPVLRVGNFFSNRDWYYSDLDLEVDKYCDKGDLLYAWSASFGPKIWDGPKVIYHYHIWKVLLNDKVNKQFVFSLLKYTTEKLKEGTHGIAMMHLTKGGMEQTYFIVPPLSLQTQFAEIVAKIEEQKALVQQAIGETQYLLDSLMSEYFD